MKYLLLITFTHFSFSQSISLKHPCTGKTIVKNKIDQSYDGLSLGKVTLDFLDENKIIFKGSEQGIAQILDTPLGDKAIVVVNDENLLAFGWCYLVNGVVPDKYADKIIFSSKVKNVIWFYGYSRNEKNKWVNMCKLASKLPIKYNPSCKQGNL